MTCLFEKISRSIIIIFLIYVLPFSKIAPCADSVSVASSSETALGNHFVVSIIPFDSADNDSVIIATQQIILDSLQAFFAQPHFAGAGFQILEKDSVAQLLSVNETSRNQFAKKNNINLMIHGSVEYDTNRSIYFHPSILMNEPVSVESKSHTAENSLAGKTCRLNHIHLPEFSLEALHPFFTILTGYSFFSGKNYDEAISIFRTDSTFTGRFYLAESYLRRGIARDKNLTSANQDWDSSLVALKSGALIAESSRDSIYVYNNLGVVFQMLGKLDSAIVYFSKATSQLHEAVGNRDRIKISNNLGNIYLLSGKWKQALDVFQANLEQVKDSSDSLNLAEAYENLGDIYQLILQRNKAIQYYDNALAIRKAMNDEAGMAICFHLLGNVYLGKNEHEPAKRHFKEGLALNLKLKNEPGIADSYDLIGQVFQDSGVADSALYYYQKSMSNYELLDDDIGYFRSLLHQASVYQKKKNFNEAIALYDKALERTNNKDVRKLRAQVYDRLGDIYNSQNNLITAYDYYEQSIALYEELQNYESLSLVLFNMGLIHLKNNEYGEGYQILKRAIEMDKEHGFNNLNNEQDFLQEVEDLLNKN